MCNLRAKVEISNKFPLLMVAQWDLGAGKIVSWGGISGDLDSRVLVVLLTDVARDTPSLIFGYSYIWLGRLCLPGTIFLFECHLPEQDQNIWQPIGTKARLPCLERNRASTSANTSFYDINVTHKCHVVHTKCSKHRAKFRHKVPTYLSMQIGIW